MVDLLKPPFFGRLANEHIQQIGYSLDIPSLCAFRRACKFLVDRTERCFIEMCFVEKHVSTTVASTKLLENHARSDLASLSKTLVIHLAQCTSIFVASLNQLLSARLMIWRGC